MILSNHTPRLGRQATRPALTTRYTFSSVMLVALLVIGCATDKEFQRKDALQRDPTWPSIRTAAEVAIADREGTTQWSSRAYYHPQQHTNGLWVVLAEGSYPMGAYGDYIGLIVRDGGEIVSASPRKPTFHPHWK